MELTGLCLLLGAIVVLLAWVVLVQVRQADRTHVLLARSNRELSDRLMAVFNLEAAYFRQQRALASEQAKAAAARVAALATQEPQAEEPQSTGEEALEFRMPSHGGTT